MLRIALILLLIFSINLDALTMRGPHEFSLGPEAYYTVRTRLGGTKQEGMLYGLTAKYERFRRCALYWAFQYDGGWGEINGHDSSDNDIKSNLTQQQIEVRGGYNYQWKRGCKFYILPFVGYGYFYQTNDFTHPSPFKVKLTDNFPYSVFGLQLGMNITPYLSIGFMGKGDWMLEGNTRIDGIDDLGTVKMNMEAKWQYDFELPITYRRNLCRRTIYYTLTPFVKIRHFGGLPGFPLDFVDTWYRSYGARFAFVYEF